MYKKQDLDRLYHFILNFDESLRYKKNFYEKHNVYNENIQLFEQIKDMFDLILELLESNSEFAKKD